MSIDSLIALVQAHAWLAIAAFVVGLLVRLVKSDSPITIPFTGGKRLVVPIEYRPWLALGLGALAGVFDKVGEGTSWPDALKFALMSAFLPIVAHELGIESLRGGKEVPLPAASKSVPPAALVLVISLLGAHVSACVSWFKDPQTQAVTADGVGLAVCVADGYLAGLPAKAIAKNCGDAALEDVLRLMASNEKVASHAHAAASSPSGSASSCPYPVKP